MVRDFATIIAITCTLILTGCTSPPVNQADWAQPFPEISNRYVRVIFFDRFDKSSHAEQMGEPFCALMNGELRFEFFSDGHAIVKHGASTWAIRPADDTQAELKRLNETKPDPVLKGLYLFRIVATSLLDLPNAISQQTGNPEVVSAVKAGLKAPGGLVLEGPTRSKSRLKAEVVLTDEGRARI